MTHHWHTGRRGGSRPLASGSQVRVFVWSRFGRRPLALAMVRHIDSELAWAPLLRAWPDDTGFERQGLSGCCLLPHFATLRQTMWHVRPIR